MKGEVFVSVDVEASGPIPGEYSMLSIGACVVGDSSETFYLELKPLNDNYVERALQVSKFSLEELKSKGKDPSVAMREFGEWVAQVCGDATPVFVAFNATFDWQFVNYYFRKFTGGNPFGVSGLDIKAYYMGMKKCSWNETVKRKIDAKYKSAKPHTHNALDDAVEQAEMFEKMLCERA